MQKWHFTLCFAVLAQTLLSTAQNLSVDRVSPRVARVGDKALFGNGQQYGGKFSTRVDIYDDLTGAWTVHDLTKPEPYAYSITVGNKVVYYPHSIPNTQLEIYDASTGLWSFHPLPDTLFLSAVLQTGTHVVFSGGKTSSFNWGIYILNLTTGAWASKISTAQRPSIARVLNKIIIAGGFNFVTDKAYDQVWLYDLDTETWRSSKLSTARTPYNPAVIGNKVIFAGGIADLSSVLGSTQVDIYDAASDTWSLDTLDQPIRIPSSVVVENTALITNGGRLVYRYDAGNGIWSASLLATNRFGYSIAVVDGKVLFAGGAIYDDAAQKTIYFNTVDIFDVDSGEWSVAALSAARIPGAAIVKNGKVVFPGGEFAYNPISTLDYTLLSPSIDVYDSVSGEWTALASENANGVNGITASKLYLAGGRTLLPNGFSRPSTKVDTYDFESGLWSTMPVQTPRVGLSIAAFPDKALLAGGRPETVPMVYKKAVGNIEIIQD